MNDVTRRFVLGSSLSGLALAGGKALAQDAYENETKFIKESFTPARPVTAITLGAGNRGHVYGGYGLTNPHQLDIIGVAEPIELRREGYSTLHDIPSENRFTTWEHVFDRPKFADAVIISTPDHLHFGPFMRALEMGYDVLLEKPMARSWDECLQMQALAQRTGGVVGVAHVLRYTQYYREMKALIDQGVIGDIISIEHREPVHYAHMAHSYVRGIWKRSEVSTPIILAKSCHDLDILYWLTGAPCDTIFASGDLTWFAQANAPEGSTERCTDPCPHVDTCPFSAVKIYLEQNSFLGHLDVRGSAVGKEDHIRERLRSTDYGRCVYKLDNNQPDHFVASLRFQNGVTTAFSLQGLTSSFGRRMRIMGSAGDLEGDGQKFVATNFATRKISSYEQRTLLSGHGGGDGGLMYDWVRAVSMQKPEILASGIDESMESHAMGFAAERSRLNKTNEVVHA